MTSPWRLGPDVDEIRRLWRLLSAIYEEPSLWRPLERLRAVLLIDEGTELRQVASELGRSPATVRGWMEGFESGGLRGLLGEPTGRDEVERHLQIFSNLLVAQLGEEIFEPLVVAPVRELGYEVVDRRAEHLEQDFDMQDRDGATAISVNVKVHSSQFRNAPDVVRLEADDCFALALYKILSGFKQTREIGVPFLFLVSIRWGIVEEVMSRVPEDLSELVELVFRARAQGKRRAEDRLVQHAVERLREAGTWQELIDMLTAEGDHRVLSAKKALDLFMDSFDPRCPALSVPAFGRGFAGTRGVPAEINMHFSIREEMEPLDRVLANLAREGIDWFRRLVDVGMI